MKKVGIVVARMGSTRVPGKSLLEVAGRPVLSHVLSAVSEVKGLDEVALATSTLEIDQPIADLAKAEGYKVFRGDPENVLDRVYGAAAELKADVLMDVGGDCPLVDPDILSAALNYFMAGDFDYLCNYEPPTFPEGLDINILRFSALEKAFREATVPSQRIHPFSYLTWHKELFKIGNYNQEPDLSELHWSIDFPEDVEFVRTVYEKIYDGKRAIRQKDVLALIERDPDVARFNEKLRKPKSAHAFWNSPGIIRDMHTSPPSPLDR